MPRTIELNQSDPVSGVVTDTVPCISADDLLHGNAEDLVELVRVACLETGFFFVDVSSIQRNAIAAALSQMQRFFALQDNDPRKQEVRQDESSASGWVPRFTEPAYQPGTVSSLEAFDFAIENVDNADHKIWPEIEGFRGNLTDCWNEWAELGESILRVIAQAAGMPVNFLVENCDSLALSTMRLLHYAPGEVATDRDVGIAAHTDFECITLLYQTAEGLELLDVNGQWLDAPVQDGRIVVLLDDMLEHWTNGLFKATGHRVRNTDERRFSIVMFFAANDDVDIAPLPQFVSANSPSRFEPISQVQHLENEMKRATENAATGK
jgi:isopenicillin N synthase-like dioxygenase